MKNRFFVYIFYNKWNLLNEWKNYTIKLYNKHQHNVSVSLWFGYDSRKCCFFNVNKKYFPREVLGKFVNWVASVRNLNSGENIRRWLRYLISQGIQLKLRFLISKETFRNSLTLLKSLLANRPYCVTQTMNFLQFQESSSFKKT